MIGFIWTLFTELKNRTPVGEPFTEKSPEEMHFELLLEFEL
jgi:hypothetical protein